MKANDFTSLSVRAQSAIKRTFGVNADKQELADAYNFDNYRFELEFKRLNCGRQTIDEIVNFIKVV